MGRVVSPAVRALRQIDGWPARNAVAGVAAAGEVLAARGPAERTFRWASVTKLLTATAVLVASEEGTVDLDEAAGPPGATLRHLLAHASGLPLDGDAPVAEPGARRIYSNTGFEIVADLVAARAPAHVLDETVDVALDSGARSLVLRVGPLRPGGGRALVVDAAVPGVGNVIEQLADELRVAPDGEQEFLHVRLEYAGAAN
jgi:hypothetical protein